MNLLNIRILNLCGMLNDVCMKYDGLARFDMLDKNTIYVKLDKWRGLIFLNTVKLQIIEIDDPDGLYDKAKTMSSLPEIIDYTYNSKPANVNTEPNYGDIDVVLRRALTVLLKHKVKLASIADLDPLVFHNYLSAFIIQHNLPVSVQLLEDHSIYLHGLTDKDKVRLIIDIKDNIILLPITNRVADITPVNQNLVITIIADATMEGFIVSYKELPESGPDIYYLIANVLDLL